MAGAFGRGAEYYQDNAGVQKEAAQRLVAFLNLRAGALPPGPILEVGCGTGFVSEGLCSIFPDRTVHLTDLSEGMVRYCAESVASRRSTHVSAFTADAEFWRGGDEYALIVAAFVAQWFKDPAAGLRRLARSLRPGGILLASVPTAASFPEWRRACDEAREPFTGAPLPEASELAAGLTSAHLDVEWTEASFTETFRSPLDFLIHLKRMGAAAGSSREPLSTGSMRRLLRAWERRTDGPARITYQVLFLLAARPLSGPGEDALPWTDPRP